jgi:hypothetical protein
MHGGSAPQVKFKALERLRALQEPSIVALETTIKQTENWPAKVSAANSILDRTGLKPTDKLDLKGSLETKSEYDLSKLTADQLAALAGILATTRRSGDTGASEAETKQD